MSSPEKEQKIRLFISCLVDNFFPEVGEAMLRVLSGMGLEIEFPSRQTCCGSRHLTRATEKKRRRLPAIFLKFLPQGRVVRSCVLRVHVCPW